MQTEQTQNEAHRVSALAESLDCLSEEDLCTLYGIAPATAKAWRKRGVGPGYILAGTRYLYPRDSIAADLKARARLRSHGTAKDQL